ncbi:MAG: cyclase family protein [Clostridia bacterium]|nr:cyclase family protein [Clostridia bacterium]
MKIHDISQEVFSSEVYPGDPAPVKQTLSSMESGDLYNLTAFSMCAHNGTHIDAPRHFIADGKSVDELALEAAVGLAYVAECEGDISAEDARKFLCKAKNARDGAEKRILLKGGAVVTEAAADVFAAAKTLLLGVEGQTVGPENAPMQVHQVLLGAGTVLLEGVRLGDVSEGACFLSAAPLNLAGADGAPCRAYIIEI